MNLANLAKKPLPGLVALMIVAGGTFLSSLSNKPPQILARYDIDRDGIVDDITYRKKPIFDESFSYIQIFGYGNGTNFTPFFELPRSTKAEIKMDIHCFDTNDNLHFSIGSKSNPYQLIHVHIPPKNGF